MHYEALKHIFFFIHCFIKTLYTDLIDTKILKHNVSTAFNLYFAFLKHLIIVENYFVHMSDMKHT